ncbi:MAG: hypothetical protein PHW62_03520 [Candidatus Ratteibacteria bacterium]|nr:hypothetical protein [Candidatus Ratteibacteria bacterium]
MVAFIAGLVAFVVGLIGLIGWGTDFVTVLKGTVPLILLLGGLIALYGAYTAQQDKIEAKKEGKKEKKEKK